LGIDIGEAKVAFDRTDPADGPDIPPHPSPPEFPQPSDIPRSPDTPVRPPEPGSRDAFVHNYRAIVAQADPAPLHRAEDTTQSAPDGAQETPDVPDRGDYSDLADPTDAPAHENVEGGTQDGPDSADGTRWAEALPLLQAEWEEHKAKYPERERATPRTHPDGSWSSGENRQLSPDQNTEATKACVDIHDEGERAIFPAMQRIEAADPDRHLAGLEHMLKGTDRMKEKIGEGLRYNPALSPRKAAADVPDAVRFTLEYSVAHYTDGVLADVERLKDAGYELVKLKNLWAKDQYKGVNSQWRRPETGLRFEVQFHTPDSREAKEVTHEAYERLRDPLTGKAEETELEDYQRRANAFLERPPDVFRIEDYPPEKRDG
jgi:hypothetical protein